MGSGNGLAPKKWQNITWINADPVHWCINVAQRGDKLRGITIYCPPTSMGSVNNTCSRNSGIQKRPKTKENYRNNYFPINKWHTNCVGHRQAIQYAILKCKCILVWFHSIRPSRRPCLLCGSLPISWIIFVHVCGTNKTHGGTMCRVPFSGQ